jgi:pSer/pThr/pTyr-binding forkhead associated (FHA) protein
MLIAKSGMHRGMVFAIEPKGIRIGRDINKNDIVINSEMVSREHAWVGLEEGKVMIKDLNSRNGTYINSIESARISREILKDGDVIFMGKAGTEAFKFKVG